MDSSRAQRAEIDIRRTGSTVETVAVAAERQSHVRRRLASRLPRQSFRHFRGETRLDYGMRAKPNPEFLSSLDESDESL